MSSNAAVRHYRFNRFELRPRDRRLLDDGKPVPIGPRAFDVLVILVERAGDLVSKEELLETAWAGLVVEDNNLQVQVSALRKLLGPQAIATVPGRGYRFATPVSSVDSGGGAGATATEPPKTEPPLSNDDEPPVYGRDEDLLALRNMIGAHALVTVVGPAGIGKTRVAEALARDAGDVFADGVRFIEFAQLADPALVTVTVSRALGIVVGDPDSALELTAQALAGQRVLLVLDNCEHLLDAVDRLVSGLRKHAPSVHVLVTSQELLRHPDEHVYRIGPLALPAEATAASALKAGATELFVARVQALEPRFELTDANVGAVIDICRRLDGIPLALELAAARVPLLGLEGVRERLDERFRLLTAGSRLALRKHQTLRAALEWSYSLLSEPEQRVFDRLGVFAGGFSLEAAQKLARDDAIDDWAVLDHLGALVNKSLVIADAGNATRYRMLETARAFALERLASRHGTSHMTRRHAEVMRALFERFWSDMVRDVPVGTRFAEFAPDLDNLRGAVRWAAEADPRTAVALVGAAGASYYLDWLQVKSEGWNWCRSLKPLIDESIPPLEAARFWLACAELGTATSLDVVAQDARKAIAIYRDATDRRGLYQACNSLSYALMIAGRHDEALHAVEEGRKCLDATWPAWFRAMLPNMASMLFAEVGQEDKARENILEQLALDRQSRNPSGELNALGLLVDLEVQRGHAERAVETAREIVARYRPDLGFDTALTLRNCATALMAAGHLDEAETIYRKALSSLRRNYGTGAFVLDDMVLLLARRGCIDDAAKVSAYAQAVYARVGRRPRLVARRNRERLLALLSNERSPDALAKLFDEGRRLTEDEACALACPPEPAAREQPGNLT
jgi:predicted ATPase/DNA-binding winged helix-turn-helix (wHTH) protein